MDKAQQKHIVIDARIRRSSTGRYIDRLIQHLQKIDSVNRYTVLLEPDDPWEPTNEKWQGVPCEFRRFSFNFLDQFGYARFLRRLRPDLVHFGMTPQEPMFYFGRRVTTTHDLTMFRYVRAGRLPAWLHTVRVIGYRLLFWTSLRHAKRIIVPTKFVAGDVAKTYPFAKNKLTVTYEASEPPLKDKAEPLKGAKKPFILHVGSPFPHKNIERLVEAFEILKKTHPDLQLVLAGKKEQYFQKLEESTQQNSPVRDDIVFTGFVSDAALKWLYQNAEVYALPSLSEGFGLPGLEAMAYGCPLASSNATCLPEVYGDAAHFFDPTSAQDMAEKISELIDDKKLQKKLVAEGQKQLAKYSWGRMAEQTLAVYKDVLSR